MKIRIFCIIEITLADGHQEAGVEEVDTHRILKADMHSLLITKGESVKAIQLDSMENH